MKTIIILSLTLILATGSFAQTLEVKKHNGGSVVTKLGMGIAVNKTSTLERTWYVVSDPTCPIQLDQVGINSKYSDRDYHFAIAGTGKANQEVRAYNVRLMLFDVWGNHMRTLGDLNIEDIPAGTGLKFDGTGSWYASERDVTEYLTCIAFVSDVLLADGKAYTIDMANLTKALEELKVKVAPEAFEPTKVKPE